MSFFDPSEMNGDNFRRKPTGTDHSEAGSMLATTALHYVHIYENKMWTESWPVNPEAMLTFSKSFYARISQDRDANKTKTLVEATPLVTANALHVILKAMSRKDAGGQFALKGCSFESLLNLSIALWSLTCSTVLFEASATAVRNSEWSQAAELQEMRYDGWMFIALVFAWGDVFEEASREVISDYSRNRELPEYLPEKLKVDILIKRTELLKEIFESIRNLIIWLFDENDTSFGVMDKLKRQGINIADDKVPENFSPEMLLKSLAAILKDPPLDSEGDTNPQVKNTGASESSMSAAIRKPQPAGARVGGLGRVKLGAIKAKLNPRREHSTTTAQPVSSPEKNGILEKWNSSIVPVLSEKIQLLRDDNFRGLKLEEYIKLRSDHILQD